MSKVKTVKQASFRPGMEITSISEMEVGTESIVALLGESGKVPNDEGEFIFEDSEDHPVLRDLRIQSRVNFSIGDEITSFKITIKPPRAVKGTEIIPPTSFNIGSRIVFPVGESESFSLSVQGVSQSVYVRRGSAMQLKMEFAGMMKIEYDNGKFLTVKPETHGFRKVTARKNPEKRYVVIIDGLVNISSLKDVVIKEALSKAGGDEDGARKISSKILSDLGVVDEIAAAAAASGCGEPKARDSDPQVEEDLISSLARETKI
jgi:hypothetical protein